MIEPRTIQEVVMASIQAEDAGCVIDWKRTCLQVVEAAQAEFARMNENTASPMPDGVNTSTED